MKLILKNYNFQIILLHFCFMLHVCIGNSSLRIFGGVLWRGSVRNIILLHTRPPSATLHSNLLARRALGARWQLNFCLGETIALGGTVNVRALQLNSCLYWQNVSFSTEWSSQRQHVYVLFCLE